MSNKKRLISDLDTNVFENLIRRPHSGGGSTNDGEEYAKNLRLLILTKLRNNAGHSITTIQDILKISSPALLHILDPCLTYVECNSFLERIKRASSVLPVSALEIMKAHTKYDTSNRRLSTGLQTLDAKLHGGFPVGSITEIVGRAGVGKTSLTQQLCVLSATSGFGGSIYIDAEKKMSVVRLREIAIERIRARQRIVGKSSSSDTEEYLVEHVLENVTIHCLLSTTELIETLDQVENEIIHRNSEADKCRRNVNRVEVTNPGIIQRLPVRLLIIDSIAAPIRRDYDMSKSDDLKSTSSPNPAIMRAAVVLQLARKLNQIADEFQLAVVVVNQVGTGAHIFLDGKPARNETRDVNDGEFTGSLGTAWQYCLSTRIVIEHEDDPHRLRQDIKNQTRKAIITKSLVTKKTRLNFVLTSCGLREVGTT